MGLVRGDGPLGYMYTVTPARVAHAVQLVVEKIVRPVPERGRARDRARELVQCPSARPVLVRVLCSTFEGV